MPTATGWPRPAPSDALPAAEGALDCDVLVVGGGYTGLWTAWRLAELEPEARVVVLEAGRCGHGPSGRNGGFATRCGSRCRLLRDRYGPEATRSRSRRAAQRGGRRDRARSAPSRRWTPGTQRAGYLQLSAAPAQDGVWSEAVALCHELGEPEAARELSAEEVAERSAARRASAPAPSSPAPRPCSRPGLRSACATGSRPAQRQGLRAVAAAPPHRGPLGLRRRDPLGHRPGALLRAGGGGCQQRRGIALPQPAHGHLEPHGDHRARPRRAGGGRLDRGRVHHRQPRDAALPAHHPRRPHRLRLGRRPDRLRRPPRRPHRVRPRGRGPGRSPTCVPSSPASRAARSSHAWGGPIDVSPTHLPVVDAGRLRRRPRRLRLHRQRRRPRRICWAEYSPRSRSTAATSAPAWPWSSRAPGASPAGCRAGSAATRSARACWPRRPPRRRSASRPRSTAAWPRSPSGSASTSAALSVRAERP